ncbi:MAG: 2,3-bisphosphoglycerate-dependent phosphoglycerate mutase [Candidatus Gribaldobacteria bacterium]|nr:2,3-bisphosphoglycerate-dependent phosphoglycerate mutase [Candidatus Gribaldobacteria bacterium]
MYKIVLLRHGESVWNRDNIFAGWTDVPLSERGVEQAKEAGRVLQENGFAFDLAFVSALQRATDTLEIILKEMGSSDVVIVESSLCLNERNYGALQGVNKKEAVEKFGEDQVQKWRRGYNECPPDGESLADVVERVTPYWQEKIIPAISQGKKVLVVAHGNSLRALVKIIDQLSAEAVESLNIPTGIPLVYEFNDNLQPLKHYYLADDIEVEKAIAKNKIIC